jgi:hypothetical protein
MTDEDRLAGARAQAKAQYDSIKEMVMTLRAAREDEEYEGEVPDEDKAIQTIHEDPLSVEVRSGWRRVGEVMEAEEYNILLCTGGPAVRIIGSLNEYREPEYARLQCQDWFTSWTEVVAGVDEDILLDYARCFFFGE